MFNLVRPCKKCPFRTDIEPYLRPGRIREIANSMVVYDGWFPCHETTESDDESDDGSNYTTSKSQHCAGAAIILMKMDAPNQMMRISMRIGMFDPEKLDMDAPVFDTFDEAERAQRRGRRS